MSRRDSILAMKNAAVLFWDFDGVIKDSVEVKGQAFAKLFEPCAKPIIEKIRSHHRDHGGMSRFDKIPLYLDWIGEISTPTKVNWFCENFSQMVVQDVIKSPWIPGVESYLRTNPNGQHFVLVSATPQKEMISILLALNLRDCFSCIWGAPTTKKNAILISLETLNIPPEKCLMIGDAQQDLDAARATGINFVLRRYQSNAVTFADYTGLFLEDFSEL